MKNLKLLLATLAGAFTYFMLGWFIYGILLADIMKAGTNQSINRPEEEMIWWAMIISSIALSGVLTTVYHWTKSISWIGGLKIGATLGVLIAIFSDLSFYSMTIIYNDIATIWLDILAFTFNSALVGIVIGLILCQRNKTAIT